MSAPGAVSSEQREIRDALRPLALLERMRDRRGDVFALRTGGGEQLLVVGDPDRVKQVFHAPADALHAGEGNRPLLGWLFGDNALSLLDEGRHMSHRRMLMPAFHARRLEHHAGALEALAGALVDRWPSGEEVASLPLLRELTLDAILGSLFGAGDRRRLEALRRAMIDLQSPRLRNGDSPASHRLIDSVGELISQEAAVRRGDPDLAARQDMLSVLLEARDESGAPMSAEEVRDEARMLLIAGYETTATALAWALERLARNPAALEAAEAEAREEGPGPYIQAVVHETLRVRPAVTMSARLVRQPFELGDRTVAPGTMIALSALLVHHRADVYPEPLAFRPERFLARRPGTYSWIPFGGGPRRCIGAGFAQMEMRIVLAALLKRMSLRPAASGPEAMQMLGSRLSPAAGGRVVFDRRAPVRAGPSRAAGARWAEYAAWEGGGLRREVFFFRSGESELYASLFSAAQPTRPYGLVGCQSWGVEADRTDPLVRSAALEMARLGGAGLVFHYPGYGDSFGDLAELDLDDLAGAAVDAVAEASRRRPGLEWILAGFAFGASVACLAQRRLLGSRLLLVQPELRPGAYLRRQAEATEPLAPGPSPLQLKEASAAPDMAYGYPVPVRLAERPAEADAAVASALAASAVEGAAIAHARPERLAGQAGLLPERFERVEVSGAWRFGTQNHPGLAKAAAEWLERNTRS